MITTFHWKTNAVTILILLAVGCSRGDGFNRVAIEGRATINGEPIQSASFTLVPPLESKSPSVYGVVSNGQYRLDRKNGPVPGPHRLEITIFSAPEASDNTEGAQISVRELGSYSIEVQVPEKGSSSLDFVVDKQNTSS